MDQQEPFAKYKLKKAVQFVERGYSVKWYPDNENWIDVYIPQRELQQGAEIRANIKFYQEPSKYGIDGGRVSKLCIRQTYDDQLAAAFGMRHVKWEDLYNYDRGLDIDRLERNPTAKRLYDEILDVLN